MHVCRKKIFYRTSPWVDPGHTALSLNFSYQGAVNIKDMSYTLARNLAEILADESLKDANTISIETCHDEQGFRFAMGCRHA